MKLDKIKGLTGKRILCVEDEDLISKMYRKGLSLTGAQVIEASDGILGLKLLKKHKVDIILLDLEMPNMNGFQMIDEVKKSIKFKDIPIIILSNASVLDKSSTIVKLKEMGVDDILIKSNTSFDILIGRISKSFENLAVNK